jgi:hypothetical protein
MAPQSSELDLWAGLRQILRVSTAQAIPEAQRLAAHYDRVVERLLRAHASQEDEPLLLAVRYNFDDPNDIFLFEVIDGFPGDPDEPLFTTEFGPNAELVILGSLHLTLASPAQVEAAVRRQDPELRLVARDGRVLVPTEPNLSADPRARQLAELLQVA